MKVIKTMMVLALSFVFFMPGLALSQEAALISLPKPKMEGGKPLMEALKDRQSQRAFSPEKLPPPVLSNLLWAAAGMNRPGKRTIPSAMNWQLVDVYVATADGLYLYQAEPQALKVISSQDVRALTGGAAFIKEAPVTLIYAADFEKIKVKFKFSDSVKDVYSATEAGAIGQNVYLFCASEGLATVIRAGGMGSEALAQAMNLRPSQRVVLVQTVGYPKKLH